MTNLIPNEALESHIAILGKTGSGKSNVAKVLAESLLARGERVCIIDPTGTAFGLRLTPKGKPSQFKPTIFGGEHADIPIAEQHGAVVAEAIGTSSGSAIIDTRLMSTAARTRFFTAFAETLLRTNKGPLHLFVDEAHLFAPQGKVNSPQAGQMLAEANELVSRGRSAGLRVTLISQRPQKLSKDALTQCETLIAMRLIHPLDRRSVDDWVGEWADPGKGKEIVASLPSLPVGDAWVWAPAQDYLKRVHFPLATTFDSGRPLGRDEAAPLLSPLDTTALGDKMDAIRQEAMENSPQRLKARIAELEKQLKVAPLPGATKAELDAAHELGRLEGHAEGWMAGYGDATKKVIDLAGTMAIDIGAEPVRPAPPKPPPVRTTEPELRMAAKPAQIVAQADTGSMSPSSIKLVDVIVAAYPRGMSLQTAAKRAGLSKRSSAFGRYLKEAASSPRIVEREAGKFVAVAAEHGLQVPSGLDDFKRTLPPSYARMVEALEGATSPMDKDDLADGAGISRTSSGLGAGIKELMALGLIESHGGAYRLHEDFR